MKNNLLDNINLPEEGEIFQEIIKNKNVTIERIISSDIIAEKIYMQEQDEWVLLIEGEAVLDLNGEKVTLKKMDYIFIESGTPHKVLKTSKGTIWLAVHIF